MNWFIYVDKILFFILCPSTWKLLAHIFSHLSRGTSGLKQKSTQTLTPSLSIVFHALSHGEIHFVPSISSKNLWIGSFWLAAEEFQPMKKRFLDLTLRIKWSTLSERAWKTAPKMVSEVVCIFVRGHLWFLKDVFYTNRPLTV